MPVAAVRSALVDGAGRPGAAARGPARDGGARSRRLGRRARAQASPSPRRWQASRTRAAVLGPADLVTLGRALLALRRRSPGHRRAARRDTALRRDRSRWPSWRSLLDAVDGRVARRTGTTSSFGARFDGEADAFLILVLSVYVAELLGWWVLVIGAARYAFGLAGLVLPWLRAPLPFRYWRKVVTAVQGVVLTVAAADVLPAPASYAAVVVALALLAESFGRDVVWLAVASTCHDRAGRDSRLNGWECREAGRPGAVRRRAPSGARGGVRRRVSSSARRASCAPRRSWPWPLPPASDRGTTVLDLCCGVGAPGRLVTARLGCDYLGVDACPDAVEVARRRTGTLPCRFEVREVPPLPQGPFDVVLLLETLLAFPEKRPLFQAVAGALHAGRTVRLHGGGGGAA